MHVILIQEGDSVVIRVPAPGADLDNLLALSGNCKLVDEDSLPEDREFRDAWTVDGNINLKKAKEIWRQKIRAVRDNRLKDLDIKWMQAMELGETKRASAIAADKQVLRDITEREELKKAKSIKDIKSFWPNILGE